MTNPSKIFHNNPPTISTQLEIKKSLSTQMHKLCKPQDEDAKSDWIEHNFHIIMPLVKSEMRRNKKWFLLVTTKLVSWKWKKDVFCVGLGCLFTPQATVQWPKNIIDRTSVRYKSFAYRFVDEYFNTVEAECWFNL